MPEPPQKLLDASTQYLHEFTSTKLGIKNERSQNVTQQHHQKG